MQIEDLVKKLTLEEKISLCSGKNYWETKDIKRLNLSSIFLSDGPHGLRKEITDGSVGLNPSYKATCFPPAVLTACSFDRDLLEKLGEAIANEAIAQNVDVVLGPGVNIKRSPLCGRNFEYFSEDPFLSGELGAAFVRGVQKKNIGTSVKHYVANNQETLRNIVSSEIDERALREIYLSSFERVVQEKPYTLMHSYNRVNGEYTGENKHLLSILRDEWGYDGVVVSDWGAVHDRVKGIKLSQDLEMPSSYGLRDEEILNAVKNGEIEEEDIDRSVIRILSLIKKCQVSKQGEEQDNHEIARMIAANSMVLLKNERELLPLNANESIGIIGALAKYPRYQGSGSSKINPTKLDNVFDYLRNDCLYASGYHLNEDRIDDKLIQDAVELAKTVKIPIVFVGLTEIYESEGYDRDTMKLPKAHDILVKEVLKVNPNTVVVLSGGSPVEMPWIQDVKAVLNAYLYGEAGAGAIVDILFGKVNPSGKLAESYPVFLEDNPSYQNFPGGNRSVYYKESIYVGYRYYEKKKKKVLFPFGHGLSYTKFCYQDLVLSSHSMTDKDTLNITFSITNTGKIPGSEIYQVYVRDVESKVFKPIKELKEFGKVYLLENETKEVSVALNKRAFAYYNTKLNDWCVESGEYEIFIGSSSEDIRLKAKLEIISKLITLNPYNKEELTSYYDLSQPFNDDEFEKLLDRKLPPLKVEVTKPYTMNSTMEEISKTFVGKFLLKKGFKDIAKKTNDPITRKMMEQSILELPIRNVLVFSGMKFNKKKVEALLLMINGKIVKGFMKFILS